MVFRQRSHDTNWHQSPPDCPGRRGQHGLRERDLGQNDLCSPSNWMCQLYARTMCDVDSERFAEQGELWLSYLGFTDANSVRCSAPTSPSSHRAPTPRQASPRPTAPAPSPVIPPATSSAAVRASTPLHSPVCPVCPFPRTGDEVLLSARGSSCARTA